MLIIECGIETLNSMNCQVFKYSVHLIHLFQLWEKWKNRLKILSIAAISCEWLERKNERERLYLPTRLVDAISPKHLKVTHTLSLSLRHNVISANHIYRKTRRLFAIYVLTSYVPMITHRHFYTPDTYITCDFFQYNTRSCFARKKRDNRSHPSFRLAWRPRIRQLIRLSASPNS